MSSEQRTGERGFAILTSAALRYASNRLEMTTYVDGTASTTRYQLDNGQTLAAIAGETSTFTLYGRGVIGTFNTEWSYILQDGAGSMRQLAKPDGAVALSVSYTPWGDTLEVYGTGMLDIGYLGGVYDAGTGLIYMGNGQYYDPSTGRFLTRGANADQSNPYTPWNTDPSGMLIAPLALLALVFGRKKNRTKLDHFVILLVIGLSVGLSVSAFAWAPTTYFDSPFPGGTQPPSGTPTAIPAPISANIPAATAKTVDPSFEVTFFEVYLEPVLDDCNRTDQKYKETKSDLAQIIYSEEYFDAILHGRKPDYRGIFIATYYKKEIENYSRKYTDVDPMMVAVGIAIQGNYSGNIGDIGQSVWRVMTLGLAGKNDAFGIAQASFSEVKGYFEGKEGFERVKLNPKQDLIAIQTMVERIHRVTQDTRIQKCPASDRMMFAIFAQQNKSFTVDDVFDIKPNQTHPFFNIYSENSYSVNWEPYFEHQYINDRDEGIGKDDYYNDTLAGGRDFMTQFMVQRAVNNMEIFNNHDIFDLPTGMNTKDIEDMKDLAEMRWNQ